MHAVSSLCLITADHYCYANPGPVNAAGNTLRLLTEPYRQIDDQVPDTAGEGSVVNKYVGISWPLCVSVHLTLDVTLECGVYFVQ